MNLDRLFLRLRYLWAFYKSTLWVTIPFGLVTGCIVFREKGIEEAVKVFLYFYTIWGLLLDAIGKLVFKKSVFFFYYNASWTIPKLYAASFGISATLCFIEMAMVLVLEADSIYYEIDGHEILKGAYINCKQGEVVGLLGRNGCGKSTMLEIIFGTRRGAHSFVRIGGKVYTDKAFRSGMLRMQPQFEYIPRGLRVSTILRMEGYHKNDTRHLRLQGRRAIGWTLEVFPNFYIPSVASSFRDIG